MTLFDFISTPDLQLYLESMEHHQTFLLNLVGGNVGEEYDKARKNIDRLKYLINQYKDELTARANG